MERNNEINHNESNTQQMIQMSNLRNKNKNIMLYDNPDHDLIEEDETNANFVMK